MEHQKIKAGGCSKKWQNFESDNISNPLTIRTLEWMVKQDISQEEFKKIKQESISEKVLHINTGEKMTGSHYDVAEVVCDYQMNLFALD